MTATVASKDTSENVPIIFDFTPATTGVTIVSAVCTVEVTNGTDSNPSAILNSGTIISGTKVTQWVRNGVEGCIYRIKCNTTLSDGSILSLAALLPISDA